MHDLTINLEKPRKIHLVGIGGSGMCGIAEVLLTHGHEVSGSDIAQSSMISRLLSLGATIYSSHEAANVDGAEIVVVSSAISKENSELIAAHEQHITVIPRAKMLSALMRTYFGIAVAGTHGKTTTTSLIASVLAQGGLDPTFVIGGLLKSAGCNAQLGASRYFVAEADESDASFLYLDPKMVVITNIDSDHLGTYNNDFSRLKQAFLDFIGRVPDDGVCVVCIDDSVVRELLPQIKCRVITYGFNENADIRGDQYQPNGMQSNFDVYDNPNNKKWSLTLNGPGKHNVQNALAAIAVALELGVAVKDIAASLGKFEGVGRRLQLLGEFSTPKGSVALVDDYGHHPREIAVTIEALRSVWPDRRLLMVFQPHRFTRTQDLWKEFVDILSRPEQLLLLEVYSAGEAAIGNVNSSTLISEIGKNATLQPKLVQDINDLDRIVFEEIRDGDVVLMQGAGNIGRLAKQLAEQKLLATKGNLGE